MGGYKRKSWTKSKKTKTTKSIALSNKKAIGTLIKQNTIKYYPVDDFFRSAVSVAIDSLGQQVTPVGLTTPAVWNLTQDLKPVVPTATDFTNNPNLSRLDRFVSLNHISLHCKWESDKTALNGPVDPLNYCNMMIILDTEPRTAAGLANPTIITDILDTRDGYVLANMDHNLFFYNNSNIGEKARYKVLKRIRIKIGPDQQDVEQSTQTPPSQYNYPSVQVNQSGSLSTRYTNINLKKKYKIAYDENNIETHQALKLLVWTDSRIQSHPLFTFQARISFSE